MQFTKKEFNDFRKEIKNAVKDVEKKFGVEINFENISYDADNTSFTVKTIVYNGDKDSVKKKEFETLAPLYGLEASDYNREVVYNGEKMRIAGIDTKRRKYPIIMKKENGQGLLFTESGIRQLLGRI